MSFKFNFDLDADDEDSGFDAKEDVSNPVPEESHSTTQVPARLHTLDELISKLPPHISFSTLKIPISSSRTVSIPRRELYDVKMQLMAEDSMSSSTTNPNEQKFTAAFTDEDIRTNTYEGGLKSWECSSDLVKHLATDQAWKTHSGRIIELGCGTALPSCFLFQSLLSSPESERRPVHLTLADYNIDVLRLVTLPNLLLTFTQNLDKPKDELETNEDTQELEITPELVTSFKSTLNTLNITIDFLSGPWSPEMISYIHEQPYPAVRDDKLYSLLLASETIYSPSSIPQFIDMVEHTLHTNSMGYIAAKDVYFGVGGSVADFVKLIEAKGWLWEVVREEKRGLGVGRVVGLVSRP